MTGHQKVSTLANFYLRLLESAKEESNEKLADSIKRSIKTERMNEKVQ